MKNKFVYLIKAGKYYKIGVTTDLGVRLDALQTANPERICLIISAVLEDYDEAEKGLHERFSDKRMVGEWFDLSDDDVIFVCNVIEFLHYSVLKSYQKEKSWKDAMDNIWHKGQFSIHAYKNGYKHKCKK